VLQDPHLRRYAAIGVAAMALDLLTKFVAVQWLQDGRIVTLTDRFSMLLVWNTGVTGGASVGPFTAQLNVVVTFLALGLVMTVVKPLADVDARAAAALGLVSGGALGNLASIVSGPAGVADFIGVRLTRDTTIVANVADLMLWTGALLLAPVAWTLVQRLRAVQSLPLEA
jgi:signal peptidase II